MTIDIAAPRLNSPRQVLFASLVGTTIEFFDFYVYYLSTAGALSLAGLLAARETKDDDLHH